MKINLTSFTIAFLITGITNSFALEIQTKYEGITRRDRRQIAKEIQALPGSCIPYGLNFSRNSRMSYAWRVDPFSGRNVLQENGIIQRASVSLWERGDVVQSISIEHSAPVSAYVEAATALISNYCH